jgi:hypothetical protein
MRADEADFGEPAQGPGGADATHAAHLGQGFLAQPDLRL